MSELRTKLQQIDARIDAIIRHNRSVHESVKLREGFWYSKDEPHFPMPEAHPDGIFKEEMLARLKTVEGKAHCLQYRGSSPCRLCDKRSNGSYTYVTDGWAWPSGYQHYLDVHNVWPSREFQQFLLEASQPDWQPGTEEDN